MAELAMFQASACQMRGSAAVCGVVASGYRAHRGAVQRALQVGQARWISQLIDCRPQDVVDELGR